MRFLLLLAIILVAGCSKEYTSGVDYYIINPPLELLAEKLDNTQKKGVEVVEIFWYGCSSCFSFEPKLKIWNNDMGGDIKSIKLPAPLNEDWTKHAKLYWSAKEIGLGDEFSDLVYQEIHVNRDSLLSDKQVLKFLEKNNIDADAFNFAYNSRQVNSKIEFSENYLKRAGIRSVPAMIIDGKYLVLENNNPEKMLEIATFLVELSSK